MHITRTDDVLFYDKDQRSQQLVLYDRPNQSVTYILALGQHIFV